MGRLSRNKGKLGEREWSKILRALGCLKCVTGRQHHGGPDSPDVRYGIPGTHAEVKRYANITVHKWMNQAKHDAAPDDIPYVAHREDHGEWLVTIRAEDLPGFVARFAAIEGRPVYPWRQGEAA